MKETRVYVFVWLPNHSGPTPCGLLNHISDGRRSYSTFKYGRRYLERKDAISLDPVSMPLKDSAFESPVDFELFNIFRDSSPDGWGRYVLSKLRATTNLGEIDYLTDADPFDRFGALGYGRTIDGVGRFSKSMTRTGDRDDYIQADRRQDFLKLVKATSSLTSANADELAETGVKDLIIRGSSLGGARPKSTVVIDNEMWLAKFERQDDISSVVQNEFVAMKLAQRYGLNVSNIKLEKVAGRYVFCIKRFDRNGSVGESQTRNFCFSGLTALSAHESDGHLQSYADIDQFLRKVGSNYGGDQIELFKRIALNIAVSNTDDHLRNHAFIRDARGQVSLSPLYDVCPAAGDTATVKRLYLHIGDEGREATFKNLRSYGERVGISKAKISSCLEELADTFSDSLEAIIESAELKSSDEASLREQFRLPNDEKTTVSIPVELDWGLTPAGGARPKSRQTCEYGQCSRQKEKGRRKYCGIHGEASDKGLLRD